MIALSQLTRFHKEEGKMASFVRYVVMEQVNGEKWVALRDFARCADAERYATRWGSAVPTSKFEVVKVLR